MFGFGPQVPARAGILVIPVFAWELSLAIYLIVKGFRQSAIAPQSARTAINGLLNAAEKCRAALHSLD